MTIQRGVITLLFFALISGTAMASEPQNSVTQGQIVSIDGVKYRIHLTEKGETLYSLSKLYGITIEQIVAANPALTQGLKAGQRLKIPYIAENNTKPIKRPKRDFTIHTVAKGETLYSISRRYSISVEALLEDNDNIDPTRVSVGQKLYIRKSEIGQTTEKKAQEELNKRSEIMTSVADGEFSYHVVHAGETVASICERFKTDMAYLLALNRVQKTEQIREGMIIKVPKPSVAKNEEAAVTDEKHPTYPIAKFKKLRQDEKADVALLLPLSNGEEVNQNYLDFYQGFLIGMDEVRRKGYSAEVTLYDTAHNPRHIDRLLNTEPNIASADIIVGPVYEDELGAVAQFAEKNSIPVVSPLANLTATHSNAVFQMSPDADSKYDKVRDLFDGTKRVVLISSERDDKEFEKEILALLGSTPYDKHTYIYEHPSIIEKRERELLNKGVKPEDIAPSSSNLSPLLTYPQESVFVILSDNEIDVDRILAGLASANISLLSRSRSVTPFVVLGNNRWNRYRNIDRAIFFTDNVIMLATYHARRDSEAVKTFDHNYAEAFEAIPSLYSYRGYDAAVIFVEALYNGIENNLRGERYCPLQTPYSFEGDAETGIMVNSEWVRVDYHRNFTATIQ